MKNRKTILPLLTLLSFNVLANDISLTPFGSANTVISSKEPNVISVRNDVVKALTSKDGAILDDTNTSDGSIVFSTLESKPFSIVVETEKGFIFTINVTPNKSRNSTSTVIHNLADKGDNNIDIAGSNSVNTSYSGVIAQIISDLLNGNTPNGFVETRKRSFSPSSTLKNSLIIRNTEAWVGRNMRVVKLDITNKTKEDIELNERILWEKNVMGISFYPSVSILPPNRRVFAYIVLKEVE